MEPLIFSARAEHSGGVLLLSSEAGKESLAEQAPRMPPPLLGDGDTVVTVRKVYLRDFCFEREFLACLSCKHCKK